MARGPNEDSFLDYLQANYNASFNPYGAGSKTYGGGRSAPNVGPVSGSGRQGYRERDLRNQAMRNRMLKKMKASNAGRFASPEYMRYMSPGSIQQRKF